MVLDPECSLDTVKCPRFSNLAIGGKILFRSTHDEKETEKRKGHSRALWIRARAQSV